ncbi:hypothetical protein CBR_g53664 [Chara braunii]|uniref:Peptidase M41 domain-containing protein n=1 Tax=Chara braunii TaxID=69332 RepID=A0A388MB92_CHABU|nr:hypothetical protein CBR_g53664 [Chara braunii]|eukprot:GBG91775.1 hypothetical protein CBR_g53664 [Chara braunii]
MRGAWLHALPSRQSGVRFEWAGRAHAAGPWTCERPVVVTFAPRSRAFRGKTSGRIDGSSAFPPKFHPPTTANRSRTRVGCASRLSRQGGPLGVRSQLVVPASRCWRPSAPRSQTDGKGVGLGGISRHVRLPRVRTEERRCVPSTTIWQTVEIGDGLVAISRQVRLRRGRTSERRRLSARALEKENGDDDSDYSARTAATVVVDDVDLAVEGIDNGGDGDAADRTGAKRVSIELADVVNQLDDLLSRGNEKEALQLLRDAQGADGGCLGFGAATQVPRRTYTLEELRMHKIEASRLLSPLDRTLGQVRQAIWWSAAAAMAAVLLFTDVRQDQLLAAVIFVLFIGTADQVANGGGGESLLIDTLGRLVSEKYRKRVAEHEAGHFLVSYLLGVLPKDYTLSSWDAYRRYQALNVQAGTTFVDFEFQEEVASGRVSSPMLDRYTCIALAGVAAEYLKFGIAEGGVSDIQQLDALFRALGFSQKKADGQVRWGVLNVVTILKRHAQLHTALGQAMLAGKTVGQCIALIEDDLCRVPTI